MKSLNSSKRSHQAGFTLIEILTVLAVISILMAILLPVLFKAREGGRQTACRAHLRQIGAAFNMWAQDHDDTWPSDWFMQPYGQVHWPGTVYNYVKDARVFTCPTGNYPELDNEVPGSQLAAPTEIFRMNYGCNETISGIQTSDIENASEIVMVGDTGPNTLWFTNPAHLNNYEYPQGAPNPDYWGMSSPGRIAYRHNKAAFFVFCDGHVGRVAHRLRCIQACPYSLRRGTRYQTWCTAGSTTLDGSYQDIFPALQQDACGSYGAPGVRPPEQLPE